MEFNKNSINLNKKHQEELEKKFGANFEIQKPNYLKEVIKWILVIIVAIAIALVLRAFVFEWVVVQGQSMENTLYNRQVLFVNKLEYMYGKPKRGDIIIIQFKEGNWDYLPFGRENPVITRILPSRGEINYIKRIIGVPGDVVDIKEGYVYINGIKMTEPYAKGTTMEQTFELPKVVPQNNVFVMGDNREYSKDSRQLGFIEYEKVKGKAAFRIRPLKEFGNIYD
ncbi:MAG: signal peptidase I [Bacillota bacterium]